MNRQTTNRVLMVRPVRFAFNEETAANNAFQQKSRSEAEARRVQQQAVAEFDAYVALLRQNGVMVDVLQDTPEPFTPDSIFPNNCFSTHVADGDPLSADGEKPVLVLYPMFAPNRRRERGKLLKMLRADDYSRIVDLTSWEEQGLFLEGTGSLILDREHRLAYACRSPRTCEPVLARWADALGYDYFLFDSTDAQGMPVYHTNVVMHVGTRFAVVCLDSVSDPSQRSRLVALLEQNGKEIVDITLEQMNQFAGNMLELRSTDGRKLLVMSQTAQRSLSPGQLARLQEDVSIVAPDISAIETAGGGSARCMLAELFA